MKVIYDTKTDTLTIVLKDAKVVESDEDKEGIILDYDSVGDVVSLEILDAKKRVGEPTQISYELAGHIKNISNEAHI